MKAWLWLGVVGMGLVCGANSGAADEGEDGTRRLPWGSDYAAARTAARLSGKPLFVVFR